MKTYIYLAHVPRRSFHHGSGMISWPVATRPHDHLCCHVPWPVFCRYFYKVKSCNAANNKCSFSKWASVTTSCRPPDAPSNFKVLHLRANSVTLKWTPPSSVDGTITSYRLFVYPLKQVVSVVLSGILVWTDAQYSASPWYYTFHSQKWRHTNPSRFKMILKKNWPVFLYRFDQVVMC